MLSPRDVIERLRRVRAPRPAEPPPAPRPAALLDVFELPSDLRALLLDLERRGQLRRALQMTPGQAALAAHLAELVKEHGAAEFGEALTLIELPDARRTEPAPRPVPSVATPTKMATTPAVTVAPAKGQPGPVESATLPPEVMTQLANLNINQWRDGRTTDGWYGPCQDGKHELFVQRSCVPPRLFKELTSRGVVRREAHGVAAGASMTFTVQAGRFPFKGVLALDVETLKAILGSSFEAIHARWDAAERKYEVKVLKVEEEKAA